MKIILLITSSLFFALTLSGCSGMKGANQQLIGQPNNTTNIGPTAKDTIQLSWKANAGEQQGFYVQQSNDGVNFTTVQNVLEPARSANVLISSGQTVSFKIQAYNQAGPSPSTTVLTVTAP